MPFKKFKEPPIYYSDSELCFYLGLSQKTLYRWRLKSDAGLSRKMPYHKGDSRQVFYDKKLGTWLGKNHPEFYQKWKAFMKTKPRF